MKSKYKISLIKLKREHFALFYKWWNDPILRKLTSESNKKISRDEINEILNRHLLNKNGFDFIITANKKPIGHILIQKKKGKKNFEIYIAIGDKRYWNKGIGTIAMQKAVCWFFKNFKNEKLIELNVLVNNIRAIKCYERVGFKKVRILHLKKSSDTILMHKIKN